VARLAIARAVLAEHAHPGQHLEKPKHTRDDRIRLMRVDTRWRAGRPS